VTQSTSTTGTLPFEPWGLKIKNIKIIKNHKRVIQAVFNGPEAKQYWTTKFQQPAASVEDLDYPAMEMALSEINNIRLKEMGGQTNHRSFLTWKEYGL